MPARLLAPLCAAIVLASGGPAWSGPAAKPAPADLLAFKQSLPAPGHDRVFLALAPELETRLSIDPAVVRAIDPGVACDPSSSALSMSEGDLGLAGHVQTTCSPNHRSQSLLTLSDGSTWLTVCGGTGARVKAWLDVQVGDKSLHASSEPATPRPEPAHDCSGWTKVSR
jgi:hypothetical protein